MGWETANIHLGTARGAAIARDLRKKPSHWLFKAASQMRGPSPGGLAEYCV